MKMPLQNSGELQEHSEAKVRLLSTYLRNYLAVVMNVDFVRTVDLYDFFCGRGLYGDKSEGSPLVMMRTADEIIETRRERNLRIPSINFHFADADIENFRVVNEECGRRHNPKTGMLEISQTRYAESLNKLLSKPQSEAQKEFVFIDPTGYSDVKPKDIKRLLQRGAEVLLFLPIQFMYRFRANATPEPLQDFVGQLPGYEKLAATHSSHAYATELRGLFRDLMMKDVFVSTFVIEKDASTLFCLYYFTPKWQGHVKMIEAKWKVGVDAGQGWTFRTVPGQVSLVGPEFLVENQILSFLSNGPKNNLELFEFGVLELEFPPALVNQTCIRMIKSGQVSVRALVGDVRKGYCYIGEKTYRSGEKKVELSKV